MERETLLKANTLSNKIRDIKNDIRTLQSMKLIHKVDIRLSDGYNSINISKSSCDIANSIFEVHLFKAMTSEIERLQKELDEL